MDLVGKPNTTSPIWNHFHSCHPSAFVQVSSSSRDRKRPAGQVCIGEAFSKLAKYKRDGSKWKILTRNVATYAAIPIPQSACMWRVNVEQWTVSKPDAASQHNRLSLSHCMMIEIAQMGLSHYLNKLRKDFLNHHGRTRPESAARARGAICRTVQMIQSAKRDYN